MMTVEYYKELGMSHFVRWGKSGLKYGYLLTDLEFIG